MKNYLILLLSILISVIFPAGADAQNVMINAEIDSFQRLIGEQAKITLEVTANSGSNIIMPTFDKEIVEGVEIIHKSQPDTQYLNDRKRIEIKEVYTVTSFDSSLYVIPPFEVMVDSVPYLSKELALAVYMMPVDTTNLDSFFGPKDIWKTSLTWDDCEEGFWFFIGFLIISAAFAWVLIRYLNNKPIIRIVKIKPKQPAHVVALSKIEQIKGDDRWRASGCSKEFYTELTDTIREYLSERFGFNAMEMTTAEIIEQLSVVENLLKESGDDTIKELESVLVMADLVKFAKLEPPMNENDRNMSSAVEFVNRTKLPDSEIVAQPTEKKIVNYRSRRTKMLLLCSVALLGAVAIALLVLLITEIYYLIA